MKRIFSLLAAVCLISSIAGFSLVSTAVVAPETPVNGAVSLELIGTERTPRGVIKTFHFNIPEDGNYHYIPEFEALYQPGTTVSFFGVWEPSYAQLAVRLDAIANGGGQIFHVTSGSASERTLYVDSIYTMQLKAIGRAISGTMQITVTEPASTTSATEIGSSGEETAKFRNTSSSQSESLLQSEEDIQYYAYLDLSTADEVLHQTILDARNIIIQRQSWVADDIEGWVRDKYGNIIETLPKFSELFPDDWDIPIVQTEVDLSYYGKSDDMKTDIYDKMLNSIDYFSSVELTMETSILSDKTTTVTYQVDLNNALAYQAVSEAGQLVSETYSTQENMIFVSHVDQTVVRNYLPIYTRADTPYMPLAERVTTSPDGLPVYAYRRNITNCPLASYCILPQELAYSYLSDFVRWEITDEAIVHFGRRCVKITGTPSPYIASKHNIDQFEMVVDASTGVLLSLSGTLNGETSVYMNVTDFNVDTQVTVKQFNLSDHNTFAVYSR